MGCTGARSADRARGATRVVRDQRGPDRGRASHRRVCRVPESFGLTLVKPAPRRGVVARARRRHVPSSGSGSVEPRRPLGPDAAGLGTWMARYLDMGSGPPAPRLSALLQHWNLAPTLRVALPVPGSPKPTYGTGRRRLVTVRGYPQPRWLPRSRDLCGSLPDA